MYERFYGMNEPAFELTSNPRFLLLTPAHREALSNLEYGIAFRRGFILLIGEAGTGKTTLLRRALATQTDVRGARLVPICMTNTTLTRDEFVEFLADHFALGASAAHSKTAFLREAEAALIERRLRGETTVLVIDEAQRLSPELLEEIRLLGNIESDTEKLLPLVLAGQPELADRLNERQFWQLKQRIALRCTLSPLSLRETAGYVAGRLRLAGGDAGAIFTRGAIMAIYRHSLGIPRLINVICENAMINGFAAERRPIDDAVIEDVCVDFDLPADEPGASFGHSMPATSLGDGPETHSKVHPFFSQSLFAASRNAPPPSGSRDISFKGAR